jgi:PAS domain S-box-containing protein
MLVSAVLLFELVLVASFAGLLGRSDSELDHSYQSVSVINHIDNLRRLVMDAEFQAGLPITNPTFMRTAKDVSFEFNALRLLLKEDGDSLAILENERRAVADELQRLKAMRERHLTTDPPVLDFQSIAVFSNTFSDNLERIAGKYRRPLEFVPDRLTLSRRMTESNIIFIVLINTVVAVATTLFFMQGIVNRLSILAENSRRYGRGDEMEPPLEGTDEIAALDRVLHDSLKQRQEVENLLKESEARTRSLIENMPVGVITVDEEGTVESINPQTERIFGYNFDEIVGDHLRSLFTASEEIDRKQFIELIYQKTLERTSRFESLRKNGELFPVEMTLTEYDSIDGKRYLAIIQDITERMRTEQFRQELIAMVSHDLRSPLTSVQGVMTLLAKGMYGQLTDTGEKRVRVAEQSLIRLVHLVDDILDLERMEAGKLQFNPELMPISSVIDRSIEAVYDFANQQQIKLETSACESEVFVDEDRIVQVVVNLLSNAIKFSPRGSTITITSIETEEEVELRVTDEGTGIPLQHQEDIFQRFHQVQSATPHKGTGLGLAIAKAIIEGHSGDIGVISEPGKGSTFWFRVPRRAPQLQSAPQTVDQPKPSSVIAQ